MTWEQLFEWADQKRKCAGSHVGTVRIGGKEVLMHADELASPMLRKYLTGEIKPPTEK